MLLCFIASENEFHFQYRNKVLRNAFFKISKGTKKQTFSALIVFESAAYAALFSKNKSGALISALSWKSERRSR